MCDAHDCQPPGPPAGFKPSGNLTRGINEIEHAKMKNHELQDGISDQILYSHILNLKVTGDLSAGYGCGIFGHVLLTTESLPDQYTDMMYWPHGNNPADERIINVIESYPGHNTPKVYDLLKLVYAPGFLSLKRQRTGAVREMQHSALLKQIDELQTQLLNVERGKADAMDKRDELARQFDEYRTKYNETTISLPTKRVAICHVHGVLTDRKGIISTNGWLKITEEEKEILSKPYSATTYVSNTKELYIRVADAIVNGLCIEPEHYSHQFGLDQIQTERWEQVHKHGYTETDTEYASEELISAALYCIDPRLFSFVWPQGWGKAQFDKIRDNDRVQQLRKAGAFIAAELDRISQVGVAPVDPGAGANGITGIMPDYKRSFYRLKWADMIPQLLEQADVFKSPSNAGYEAMRQEMRAAIERADHLDRRCENLKEAIKTKEKDYDALYQSRQQMGKSFDEVNLELAETKLRFKEATIKCEQLTQKTVFPFESERVRNILSQLLTKRESIIATYEKEALWAINTEIIRLGDDNERLRNRVNGLEANIEGLLTTKDTLLAELKKTSDEWGWCQDELVKGKIEYDELMQVVARMADSSDLTDPLSVERTITGYRQWVINLQAAVKWYQHATKKHHAAMDISLANERKSQDWIDKLNATKLKLIDRIKELDHRAKASDTQSKWYFKRVQEMENAAHQDSLNKAALNNQVSNLKHEVERVSGLYKHQLNVSSLLDEQLKLNLTLNKFPVKYGYADKVQARMQMVDKLMVWVDKNTGTRSLREKWSHILANLAAEPMEERPAEERGDRCSSLIDWREVDSDVLKSRMGKTDGTISTGYKSTPAEGELMNESEELTEKEFNERYPLHISMDTATGADSAIITEKMPDGTIKAHHTPTGVPVNKSASDV